MFVKQHNTQTGSAMLFALLILGVMAAIGFVLSSLVYREVNVARSFDDSIQAYYAAETGIERALDIVGEHRKDRAQLESTLMDIETYAAVGAPFALAGSDSSYVIDSAATNHTTTLLRTPILTFFQIELYDPDDPINTLMSADSMRVQWNQPADCPANAQVEFTFQEHAGASFGLEEDSVYKQVYSCGVETPTDGYDCQATSNWPAANTNYIVGLYSYQCDRIDAAVSFYDANNAAGTQQEIPSVINITSVGSGNISQRVLTAHTKWVPTASGLSSFVLFSVQEIVK